MLNKLTYIISFILMPFLTEGQTDTLWNQTNAEGEKHGYWKDYYPNGTIRYRGQFQHGEPLDLFKYYFKTGDLKSILRYRSKREAYAKHFYSTGEIMAEGKYLDRKKDSLWINYGANNIKLKEGFFEKGKKQGSWKTFFPDGRIAEEKFYKDDTVEGVYTSYFANGRIKQKATYQKGMMEGKTTFYDSEGNISIIGKYYHDSQDSVWTYYNEDGEVEKVLQYDRGKLLNPEAVELEIDTSEYIKKDVLEFEDIRGKIKP